MGNETLVIVTDNRRFNPLRLNINTNILHTALYTFPNVLARRIFEQSIVSLVNYHFVYCRDRNV